MLFSFPDSAIKLADVLLQLSNKINNQYYSIKAINAKGIASVIKGDHKNALYHFNNSLKKERLANNKNGMADIYLYIGNTYLATNDLENALVTYEKSRDLFDEMGNHSKIAAVLNNIGSILQQQKKYEEALNEFKTALQIHELSQNEKGVSDAKTNIATVYMFQEKHEEALLLFNEALQFYIRINNLLYQATIYNHISKVYNNIGEYDKSILNSEKGFEIANKIGALKEIEYSTYTLYGLYKKVKNKTKALEMYELYVKTKDSLSNKENSRAIMEQELKYEYDKKSLADSIYNSDLNKIQSAELKLKEVQLREERNLSRVIILLFFLLILFAFFIWNRFRKIKDQNIIIEEQKSHLENSMNEITEKNKELTKMSLFPAHNPNPVLELDFDLKIIFHNEGALKYPHLKELMYETHPLREKFEYLLNKTIKNKPTGKYMFKEPFVLDDTYFDLNLYVDNELKFIRAYLNDITDKVNLQKKITQQRDSIIDSLNYAKYIQRSLLPDLNQLNEFFNDNFVFNWPKDIVGGDFYWFKSFKDKAIIVAADCTGHGVPGGFITVLGSMLINNSVGDKFKSPNQVLADLNIGIIKLLKQQEEDAVQDGMDLSICLVDKKERTIHFSGSRNGLYIVNGDDIDVYKGDVTPVGGYFSKKDNYTDRKYELHKIKLKKDDWVFMYSDGFYDQFGGPKNKSMGSMKFKETIKDAVLKNKTTAPDFKDYFFKWMGDQQQIDDVLVIGFNI